jgi:hypothetical protein
MSALDAPRWQDDVKTGFHVCSMLIVAGIVWGREVVG